MWTTEHTIVTDASKESVWKVWADVENWSKWDKGVERHPTVQLSLTVYTLSLDRAWLEL